MESASRWVWRVWEVMTYHSIKKSTTTTHNGAPQINDAMKSILLPPNLENDQEQHEKNYESDCVHA